MTFSQLTSGTRIHVLEITGTFKKNTTYSLGTVVSVSKPYDEPVPPTQFPMPMQNRRKLVDLVISCDGEQRKLSVSEDKTMMTDSSIGLTIATEKSQIVNMVRQSLDDCRIKKESLSKIDEEMRRCEDILKILNVNSDITTNVTKDFKELDELRAEVKELKQLLQNVSAVRPEVIKNTPPNSTEDYTTAEKSKLAGLSNYNDDEVRELISALNLGLTTLEGDYEALEARVAALETPAA